MDNAYKGTSLVDMHRGRGPWSYEIPTIYPSKYHTILYEVPPHLVAPPKPHISVKTYHWDEGYLRMPYSRQNLYPSKDKNGKEILMSRWELIQSALSRRIASCKDLEAAICTYNSKLPKFTALHYLFEEVLNEDESEHFFTELLPKIVKLAMQLPEIVPGSIPLLQADSCKSLSLSQYQIASLLANCFLCTFPWRKDVFNYPGADFVGLFSGNAEEPYIIQKLICILHYFRRVTEHAPFGVVTFERQHLRRGNMPRWDKITNNLGNTRLHVSSTGTIEDDGLGLLQVDFANRFVGGGVLTYGCVQEEIRFIVCPELIVSRLFTEKLSNTESLFITGVERFSKYRGYGTTFEWAGNYEDDTPFDGSGRRQTCIVAIDATYYAKPYDQFHSSQILRELNKAFAGFHSRFDVALPAVATGNWGCGAFRGNVHLKFLVQLMACSAAKRDMVYFTFGDDYLLFEIYNIYTFIATNQITICQLWRILCRFVGSDLPVEKFFPFVQQAFFDSKTQPTIKSFLNVLTKKVEKEKPAVASTSSEKEFKECKPTDEEFVAIEMDEGFEMLEVSPTPVKKLRVQSEDNLLSLIGKIDGRDVRSPKSWENGGSFLSTIDHFTKEQIGQKKHISERSSVSDELDVDRVLPSLCVSSTTDNPVKKVHVVEKKKITDYFKKI